MSTRAVNVVTLVGACTHLLEISCRDRCAEEGAEFYGRVFFVQSTILDP